MNAPTKTGPSIKRGASKQDHQTPPEFLAAAAARFGALAWDLAATKENSACGACYYGPDQQNPAFRDALKRDWSKHTGTLWLNPEFANIKPWAKECEKVRERPGWTLLLVPAAVGSNWYEAHVKDKAFELYLNGRILFVGETIGYPKDLMLVCYGFGVRGSDTWRWDTSRKWRIKR